MRKNGWACTVSFLAKNFDVDVAILILEVETTKISSRLGTDEPIFECHLRVVECKFYKE